MGAGDGRCTALPHFTSQDLPFRLSSVFRRPVKILVSAQKILGLKRALTTVTVA
jgi:hypothetical protein